MQSLTSLHSDLLLAKELAYDACGFEFKNVQVHSESAEYAACSFELNVNHIEHRCSKITPTKIGQFVTIWKRNKEGITAPFDLTDGIDFIIITARNENDFGQFIFPAGVLADKGIISTNDKGGKRGIRVYPPWDKPTSKQALATQEWQLIFFVRFNDIPIQDMVNEFCRLLRIGSHVLTDNQIAAVNQAREQIKKGEYITHEEVQIKIKNKYNI